MFKCFLECALKAGGYPTNGNMSGKFIEDALVPYEVDGDFSLDTFFYWSLFADGYMTSFCNSRCKFL